MASAINTEAKLIGRIKAIAQVFNVDTTKLDDDILMSIYRKASASEWALVEDSIRGAK